MRVVVILLLLTAAGCASTGDGTLHREVGSALQRFGARATRGLAVDQPGRVSLLDERPMFLDFRNAIQRLPATLRLDVPPFPDYHASVRMAETGSAWQPQGILTRALTRLLP